MFSHCSCLVLLREYLICQASLTGQPNLDIANLKQKGISSLDEMLQGKSEKSECYNYYNLKLSAESSPRLHWFGLLHSAISQKKSLISS